MTIQTYSAEEAFRRTIANKCALYPSPKRRKDSLVPFPKVAHTAPFRFDRSAPIYAVGSCFARNVELSLEERGFNVASLPQPDSPLSQVAGGRSLFNKYAPHAIEQELSWALHPDVTHPGDLAFLRLKEDEYLDPHFGGSHIVPLPELQALRAAYNTHIQGIKQCPVLIITLGLVECWYDKELDLYLNLAPPHAAIAAYPGRFEFRVLDYAEVLESLERSYGLLQRFGHPELKLLVTVSPVPLARTFRDDDVLQASCYSKSVLRAAVEVFRLNKENVAYFPSYEIVTLADRAVAWGNADYRHVNPNMVARVMQAALSPYVGDDLFVPFDEGRLLYKQREYEKCLEVMLPLAQEPDANYLVRWTCALCFKHLGRQAEMLEYMALASQADPSRTEPFVQRLRVLSKLDRRDEVAAILAGDLPASVADELRSRYGASA